MSSTTNPQNPDVETDVVDVIDTADAIELEIDLELDDSDTDVDSDVDADATDDLAAALLTDDDESDESDHAATEDADSDVPDGVAFDSLGLPGTLTELLAHNGVTTAFPIQSATIPDALEGRHILGKARTGSGKTLAFGLPMLANLEGKRARKGKPLGLI